MDVFSASLVIVFTVKSLLSAKANYLKDFKIKSWVQQKYVALILLIAVILAVGALKFYLIKIGMSVSDIVSRLTDSVADPNAESIDLRNLSTAVALLMGVLAAAATIFFSVIRVWINERTASATEQALFNNKINAAFADLHAQRQVTKWLRGGAQNGWEDDVTRRNGAIDRLFGLASEEADAAPRIARMLSVYVKELSREFPAKTPPKSADQEILNEWASNLKSARSDMQNAVQVLGSLRKESGVSLSEGEIDLTNINLQGLDLYKLNFDKVSFSKAHLQGANLRSADLNGSNFRAANFQGTHFANASLKKAYLAAANLQQAQLSNANLEEANLNRANLRGADLRDANLQRTKLSRSNLQATELVRANLRNVQAPRANLNGANLKGVELQGADLFRASLIDADLTRAQLQGVNLVRVTLNNGTSLDSANMRGAAVKDVNFTDTGVSQKQMQAMFGDASVVLPVGLNAENQDRPTVWIKIDLGYFDFLDQWRAFQASIGQDPENPE